MSSYTTRMRRTRNGWHIQVSRHSRKTWIVGVATTIHVHGRWIATVNVLKWGIHFGKTTPEAHDADM